MIIVIVIFHCQLYLWAIYKKEGFQRTKYVLQWNKTNKIR